MPIKWTAYQIRADFGKDQRAMEMLENYVKGLPAKIKFFTVVQYDDGALAINRGNSNILTFAGGGVGDIPVALTAEENEELEGVEKNRLLASFAGELNNHPIRKEMAQTLQNIEGFEILQTKNKDPYFLRQMQESTFALCPRGYGRTSFRMYEAMQLGIIPVYISDVHWIPFNIPKHLEFCIIKVFPEEIRDLPEYLTELSQNKQLIKSMSDACKWVWFNLKNYTFNDISERLNENNKGVQGPIYSAGERNRREFIESFWRSGPKYSYC